MKNASLHKQTRCDAFNLDKGMLHELYIEKKLPCTKVAEILNVSPNCVKKYLKSHGFKIRHESTYKAVPLPKDKVIAMYVDDGISATKIAKKYNTCTGTISNRLKKWGVDILHGTAIFKTCNYSRCDEPVKVWPKDIRNSKYDCFYCCKDHAQKGIAERGINAGKNNPRYSLKVKTKCSNCGKLMKVNQSRIPESGRVYCDMQCKDSHQVGSESSSWKGGVASEPYCPLWLNKEFRKDLLDRDNRRCQNPDCWNTVDKLSIHHIDYGKKNCHPDNLITLCVSCNSRANVDREWHTSWYTAIMQRSGKTININH